jgi:hypothetical protein
MDLTTIDGVGTETAEVVIREYGAELFGQRNGVWVAWETGAAAKPHWGQARPKARPYQSHAGRAGAAPSGPGGERPGIRSLTIGPVLPVYAGALAEAHATEVLILQITFRTLY